MDYHAFTNELTAQLTPLFPAGTELHVHAIPKNNGVFRDALVIREPKVCISPTIYIDDYYRLYQDGTPIEEICRIICDVFLEVRLNHPIEPSAFTDFSLAKETIIFQLINREKNRERLTELPHIPYLDLAVIFCCVLQLQNGEQATVTIKHEHLQLWHTDFETVRDLAFAHTPRLLPAYIQPISETIRDLMAANPSLERMLPLADADAPKLYVLTNETQVGGAACLLYPTVLSDFADELGQDLYVLPSSIHEVLLFPTDLRDADTDLNRIICQVNEEQLPETQQLSDHVYYYSRTAHALAL